MGIKTLLAGAAEPGRETRAGFVWFRPGNSAGRQSLLRRTVADISKASAATWAGLDYGSGTFTYV